MLLGVGEALLPAEGLQETQDQPRPVRGSYGIPQPAVLCSPPGSAGSHEPLEWAVSCADCVCGTRSEDWMLRGEPMQTRG